jgi:hypothetical protein
LLAVSPDGLGAARQQTYKCCFTRGRLQQIVHIQRYVVLASFRKKETHTRLLNVNTCNRLACRKATRIPKIFIREKNSLYVMDWFRRGFYGLILDIKLLWFL